MCERIPEQTVPNLALTVIAPQNNGRLIWRVIARISDEKMEKQLRSDRFLSSNQFWGMGLGFIDRESAIEGQPMRTF
jgi:hypothetical protein